MGGTQAAKVMTQIEVSSLKKKAEKLDEKVETEIFEKLKAKYEKETSSYYAASRLWVDAIIDPRSTRSFISQALQACNHAPIEKFNVGVIQT
jgi:acetyl-CoA carboxylase carboxyltransferase component